MTIKLDSIENLRSAVGMFYTDSYGIEKQILRVQENKGVWIMEEGKEKLVFGLTLIKRGYSAYSK